MAGTGRTEWYEDAFDEHYVRVYAHRDDAEAAEFVRTLRSHIPLEGLRVLDLACGAGRYLRALSKAAARPVGFDLSAALLSEAASAWAGPLVRGDMRALPFEAGAFDLVASMFTSFGYFTEMGKERRVLAEVERCLSRGGWFVIDHMNASLVRRTLEAESRRSVHGLDVTEKRSISADGRRVLKEVELRAPGVVKRYCESVRLLSLRDISGMLSSAGLRPVVVLGGYAGEEYDEDSSPRMIVICRKPA